MTAIPSMADRPFGCPPDTPARCSCGGKGKLVGTIDGKPLCGKCLRYVLRAERRYGKRKLPSKYGAKRAEVDGISFHSQAEARRYCELKLLQEAGKIRNLERQVPYPISINGVHVTTWFADFVYFDDSKRVVEDVKGYATKEYKLKRKLVQAAYGVTIKEVKAR